MLALTGHSGQVTDLAYSPDSRWLASTGWDGSARLWDTTTHELARYLRTPYDYALTVAFASDGRHLAIGFRNRDNSPDPRGFGNLAWTPTIPHPDADADTLPPRDTWFAFEAAAKKIVAHPTPGRLAAYGDANCLCILDAANRERLIVMSMDEVPVDLALSPDGDTLAAVSAADGQRGAIHVWEYAETEPVEMDFENDRGRSLAFTPDGSQLFAGFASGRLVWWEMSADARPNNVSIADVGIVDMAFSPDGRSLLLAGEDGLVRLWDRPSQKVRTTFDWGIGTIQCVAFAPDGLTAAAGGDGVVLVWEVEG